MPANYIVRPRWTGQLELFDEAVVPRNPVPCPHCGQPLPDAKVPYFDEVERTLSFKHMKVKLTKSINSPLGVAMVKLMIDSYPKQVSHDDVLVKLWGAYNDPPENNKSMISMFMSHLRDTIEPIGWTVKTIPSHTGIGRPSRYVLRPFEHR